jgi:uncharacterized secreted protein with C-terminal beta-propeller domain
MEQKTNSKLLLVCIGIVVAVIFGFAFSIYQDIGSDPYAIDPISSFIQKIKISSLTEILKPSKPEPGPANLDNIAKFASEQEFKEYLEESQALAVAYYGGISMGRTTKGMMDISMDIDSMATPEATGIGAETFERVSETNVQVCGIDEPDIVKTDGKEIYFSSQRWYFPIREFEMDEIAPGSPDSKMPQPRTRGIKAIKAFPVSDLKVDSEIEQAGNLLLSENVLVVFSGQDIIGYDVSNPENIEQKWEMEMEDRNHLVSSRLYKGKVYLVIQNRIDTYRPCPIMPFPGLEIKCAEIYHPRNSVPIDVTFSAMVLNPKTGEIEDTVSFVGSSSQSIVYMSENGIYISYSYYESMIDFFYGFFQEECADIVPSWVVEKLEKLKGYDISDSSKMNEFGIILDKFYSSLSDDERMRLENEFTNRMDDYYTKHSRDFEKTGIVKIKLDGFDVAANGVVPGRPLNQFSLDEYDGYLRIATTIGDRGMGGMFWGVGESVNDVYVVDSNLNITGSVKGLGITERIYSVRFIADKGYVVTYRQIDPFYVLDLSDPRNPELKGELKIPGYSSYLHPINKDRILGMGKEGSKVKVSLFDVKSAENPKEADKYLLDEYWSDVLNTHHAFLLDAKHKIFFLPGTRGGYIFSYAQDKLKLIRAVSGIAAKRAIYINDYLYIVGEDKIIVLDETNWEEINKLSF